MKAGFKPKREGHRAREICVLMTLLALGGSARAQSSVALHLEPAQSVAKFTLSATAHTVHGTFRLRSGDIRFDPASGNAGGEIVFDATSGETGNGSRDHKMHKDVLQSQQYPDLTFRPDHAEGTLSAQGKSTFQVHGKFGIHGAEHEITVPVDVSLNGDKWTASAKFPIPYVEWGMKNPSNFFLHVGDVVNLELEAGGTFTRD